MTSETDEALKELLRAANRIVDEHDLQDSAWLSSWMICALRDRCSSFARFTSAMCSSPGSRSVMLIASDI